MHHLVTSPDLRDRGRPSPGPAIELDDVVRVFGRGVLELLRRTVDEGGRTLVMVTHDPSAAAWADRVVFMADGRLAGALSAPASSDPVA